MYIYIYIGMMKWWKTFFSDWKNMQNRRKIFKHMQRKQNVQNLTFASLSLSLTLQKMNINIIFSYN